MIVDGVAKSKNIELGKREQSMASANGHCGLNIPSDQHKSHRSRTGHNFSDMAQSKCLYEIPYRVTREIVMSMDADKSWESLAGEIGYSFDKLKHFELEYQRYNGSPTKALLWDWGSHNATVNDLYNKLKVLNRIREMKILDDYVCGSREANNIPSGKSLNWDNPLKKDTSVSSLPCVHMDDLPAPPSRRQPTEEADANQVNFNQPKTNVTKLRVSSKVESTVKDKQYDDKKIPGTTLNSLPHAGYEHNHSSKVPQESVSMVAIDTMKASESTETSSIDLSTSSSEKSDSMKGFETLKSYMKKDNLSLDDAVAFMGTPIFEYKELYEATDSFSTSHKLGAGAFGTVYKGMLRCSTCAIKRLEGQKKEVKENNSAQLRSELTALLRYRHENIVNLYGYAYDGPSLCIVYQYMVNGSLEDRLQCKNKTPALSWFVRINIALGAAKGLHFLHSFGSKPLIHGDMKSANILLDKHMEAKIGDLGQAQHANSGELTGKFTHITQKNATSKLYGTRAYLAPEVERGGAMSIKSDVFAFGVVLLEMCSGMKSYDDKREGEKFLRPFFEDLKDEAKDDEEKLCKLFRDKQAGECPNSLVVSLISAADHCITDKKKNRIEMEKLLHQLESLEDKIKDIQSTSMSPYVSSFFVNSHHLSHISGDGYSAPNFAANTSQSPGKSVFPSKQPGLPSKQPITGSDEQPASPVDYFIGKDFASLPEALKLQMIADARKEGGNLEMDEIKMYKAMNKQREASELSADPDSDPKKMQEIQKYNEKFEKASKEDKTDPGLLASDPKKLEALIQFDKVNPMTHQGVASDEHLPAADPEKMRKIKEYDNQLSSGSMPSGLLYGDHRDHQSPHVHGGPSPVISVVGSGTTGNHQHVPGHIGSGGVSAGSVNVGGSSTELNCGQVAMVQHSVGQLNISPHDNQGFSHEAPISNGIQTGGQGLYNVNSPFNSGNFSGSSSCFDNESQPTMIVKNLPSGYNSHIQHVPSQSMGGSHSPGASPGSIVMEVCEETTPMAKLHAQSDSYPVPRQQTDTHTSEYITYTSANNAIHSLPSENVIKRTTESCTVTDVLRSTSYPGERRTLDPAVRQSEGFQYTGCFDQREGCDRGNELPTGDQNEGPVEYGGHIVEGGHFVEGGHIVEGVGHIVEGEGHINEGEGHEEGVIELDEPSVVMNSDPQDKINNFFNAYNMCILQMENEEEENEGVEEDWNGEEDEDSVTHINV